VVEKGGKLVLTFKDVQGGLLALGGGPVKGFALAGDDRRFHWAQAKIVGKDTVEVSASEVKVPVEVRYAWADNPDCNLFTKEGYPAAPFRHRTKPLPASSLDHEPIPDPSGD
jgi:sialate O-acetylesterase